MTVFTSLLLSTMPRWAKSNSREPSLDSRGTYGLDRPPKDVVREDLVLFVAGYYGVQSLSGWVDVDRIGPVYELPEPQESF